jgi:glycosyltransferase involved in cell wall biosynthesis
MSSRHGPRPQGRLPVEVITQGFDDQAGSANAHVMDGLFDPQRLELLYTGSFYRFRRPDALLAAIAQVPGVRLNIASVVIPEWLRATLEENPDQVRVLGYLPHLRVRRLQQAADVLVNIANDDPCQMPGKVFEYFGAGRPILHVCKHADRDLSASLVNDRRRGWVSADDAASIAELLRRLQQRKPGRVEDADFDREGVAILEFGWSRLAARFLDIAKRVTEQSNSGGRVSGR